MSISLKILKTLFSTVIVCASLSSHLYSQTVSTPIVGFQKTIINPGLNSLGFPLLNSPVFSGQITTNSTSLITVSGNSDVGATLSANEPYYMEVTSGVYEGERFEVNVSATISSANNSITIVPSSPNNTASLSSGMLTGSAFNLIKHITLSQLQASVTGGLTGNNTVANADQIIVLEGGASKTYYLRSDGVSWRVSGSTNNQAKSPILPGSGVLLKKVGSSPTELVCSGSVRGNNFSRNYLAGLQLSAPAFPIAYSPNALGANTSSGTGWVGNNNQSLADQIIVYTSGAPKTYYLRSDGTSWRTSGNTNSFSTTDIVQNDAAFFVKRSSSAEVLESKPQ